MNEKSDTPRTDALDKELVSLVDLTEGQLAASVERVMLRMYDFARTLERELNEVKRMLNNEGKDLSACLNDKANLQDEREQLRADLKQCAEALKRMDELRVTDYGSLRYDCLSNSRIQAILNEK